MPVGDCQREFKAAAAEDGIILSAQSFPWLCEQGHFGLLRVAEELEGLVPSRLSQAAAALEAVCAELGGDREVLRGGRTNPLRGDFVHEESVTMIEIDESQHF